MNSEIPIITLTNGYHCPHCDSHRISKNGKRDKEQQYKCNTCHKRFGYTHGTAIHRIHKRKQFIKYAECLTLGMTIRQAAKEIGISIATSFAWRHKYLSAQKQDVKLNPLIATGILRTNYSEKGRKKKALKTQSAKISSTLMLDNAGNLQLHKTETSPKVKQLLKSITNDQTQLYWKKDNLLTKSISFAHGLKLRQSTACKKILLDKIDRTIQDFHNWLAKFRGVATKYLQQYMNWYVRLEEATSGETLYKKNVFMHRNAYENYRQLRNR